MPDHRIRLDDEALELIVSALYARTAAVSPKRRTKLLRLAERLADCAPGNPRLRFDWTHEQAV
jgi:antitoxin component of MazEF toxin-antitoxin module